MNTKLTAKETALMTAIADGFFSFFDQGLVHGSGIWTECLTDEITGMGGKRGQDKYDVSKTQRGAASVVNSLGRKGLLVTETNEDGSWTDLTPEGQVWVETHNAAKEPAAATAATVIQDVEPGTPEDEIADALAEIEAEEAAPVAAPTPAKKARKLPLTSAAKMPKKAAKTPAPVAAPAAPKKAAKTPAPAAPAAPKKAAKTAPVAAPAAPAAPAEDPGYAVTEWAEDTASHGTEEWIETKFADGSWTLRRRRNVSGAWRTDFWGQAAGSDKRVFTTSGAAKAARTAGKFEA